MLRVNPKFHRPAEVDLLIGDPSKARDQLGWAPTTTLEQLCQMMVDADLRRNEAGFVLSAAPPQAGCASGRGRGLFHSTVGVATAPSPATDSSAWFCASPRSATMPQRP